MSEKVIVVSSNLLLKPSLSQSLSFHIHLSFSQAISWNLTTRCLAVSGLEAVALVSAADETSPTLLAFGHTII